MNLTLDKKEIKPGDQVITSLLNLRSELRGRGDVASKEFAMKINSCLYDKYPVKYHVNIRGTD